MPGQLQAIVTLNEVLIQLGEMEARLAGIPDWMQELHEEHSRYLQEIETAEAEIQNARQERRSAEAATADAEERQNHFQGQISAVSTQREYGALLKEIDTTKQQIAEFEQQALDALARQETAEAELEKLRENFQDLDSRYNSQLAKWESEKPSVASAAEELKSRAEEQKQSLPPAVFHFFERLWDRYGDGAMARVVQVEAARGGNVMWHCSACSYRVRPQVVVEIRSSGNVVQCDSCKRILFFVEPEEQG